jgi:hypothetical protein
MMTHEQRLDRLERIAKLFVKAGLRQRANLRRMDEKINILIDTQIKNEDGMAELRKNMNEMLKAQRRNDERFAKTDERFARSDERFAKFESHTDETLKTLKELLRQRNNGSR